MSIAEHEGGNGAVAQVNWSVVVHRIGDQTPLFGYDASRTLRTVSIGKLLLPLEVGRAIESSRVTPDQPIHRDDVAPVADSGIWQDTRTAVLPLHDVARLVGLARDNWATNALLDVVGLDAVQRLGVSLGFQAFALHDEVRDARTAAHPETLSTANAAELVSFFRRLEEGTLGPTRGFAPMPVSSATVKAPSPTRASPTGTPTGTMLATRFSGRCTT